MHAGYCTACGHCIARFCSPTKLETSASRCLLNLTGNARERSQSGGKSLEPRGCRSIVIKEKRNRSGEEEKRDRGGEEKMRNVDTKMGCVKY